MEFLPELKLTLFNGWIFLFTFYLLQLYNLTFVSKQMRDRLLDRSNFDRKQWFLTLIGKFFAIPTMILMILTPITSELIELFLGIVMFLFGMVGLRMAVLNFINTPLDQPVTKGLYSVSRNPQETMLSVILFGIGFTVGSWMILILLVISRVFNHFQILAQEEACITQYGDSYQEYMNKVPRYFLVF